MEREHCEADLIAVIHELVEHNLVEVVEQPQSVKSKVLNSLARSKVGSPIAHMRRRRAIASYRKRYWDATEAEFQLNATQRSRHRNPVRQYVLRLLNALLQDAPPPPPPVTGDEEIDRRLIDTKNRLIVLFEEYRDKIELGAQELGR